MAKANQSPLLYCVNDRLLAPLIPIGHLTEVSKRRRYISCRQHILFSYRVLIGERKAQEIVWLGPGAVHFLQYIYCRFRGQLNVKEKKCHFGLNSRFGQSTPFVPAQNNSCDYLLGLIFITFWRYISWLLQGKRTRVFSFKARAAL